LNAPAAKTSQDGPLPLPELSWRIDLAGSGSSQITGLATLAGDILAIGSFDGETLLGSQRLVSAGEQDVLAARIAPDRQVRWVRRWGGSGYDSGDAIEAGADGSLLVMGSVTGTVDWDGAVLAGDNSSDCFIAKLRGDDGHTQWVRRFGGPGGAACRSAAYDREGDVWVTGRFDGEVDLGMGPQDSVGANDVFLVKLSGQDGKAQFARFFGGAGDDIGRDIAVTPSGEVLLTGHFSSGAGPSVGAVDFGTGRITSAGDSDAFLAAFSRYGHSVWARPLGGQNFDMAKSVVPAVDGTLFLTGLFQGEVTSRPGELLFSAGGFEGFVARLSAQGEELWRHRYPALTSGHALALTPSGDLAMVGHFTSTLDLGAGQKLQSRGGNDVVVVIFGVAGEVRWTDHLGGAGADYGYAVTAIAEGVAVGGMLEEVPARDARKPRSYGFVAWFRLR
jgi:hypothetical protein